MFNRKVVEKIFSMRSLSWLATSSLLASCATSPNMATATPPDIKHSTVVEAPMPTKNEFLSLQGDDVKNAFTQYEKTGDAPEIKNNQSVKIPFGKNTPILECAPLHACDIKLEVGEKITGVYPGDTSRWLFEAATSGEGVNQQMHVVFKPKDYDISSNAIITTTKRTYHLELRSVKNAMDKTIEFYYPTDIQEQLIALKNVSKVTKQAQHLEVNNPWNFHQLNFHYRIETRLFDEKPSWTPISVFNDGTHVYIQMPPQVSTTSLPTLFIVGHDGEPKLVNFRVKTPYFIVDELFQNATLESGVGHYQQRVTITYSE